MRVAETGASVVVEPLPFVVGDATLLTQLFQNRLGNALKFIGPRSPEVQVTCAREGGELVVGVKDNGIGMDPQYCEKTFAPFQCLHGRDQYEGTGIGLTIARKVVERHGGRIWAEASPDQGSHFKFTLAGMHAPEPASA